MITNPDPSVARTRIGSRIPFSLIEATISERSPKCFRGWCGLGSIRSMSIIRPIDSARVEVISSTKWLSWRIRLSSGKPRILDTGDDLLGKAVVLGGPGRAWGEREDALLVRGALLEADALGDGRSEDLLSEHV